mmetsp:Transcript_21608/g.47778  ORF Transcript_21608/g.47778 Transcript_21608/m.47778 type:complete len:140 (-) Transcript_21608:405-824(-)|eukprot:CAMPEP_0170596576 /NCGR_PEP_ID=MMETSP0224-20130122/15201_1 /TAXON_ID=285029 /ORGANISM="Togula jolla, Strain CCCM 725" /LENGTH=139 /DNA_ID=CAMNT_0010920897 /DNA_START=78 /DNA_END=497 /DNA_ORIENTATION=-
MADLISLDTSPSAGKAAAAAASTQPGAADARTTSSGSLLNSFDPLAPGGGAPAAQDSSVAPAQGAPSLGLPDAVAAAFSGKTEMPPPSAIAQTENRDSSGLSADEQRQLMQKVSDDAQRLRDQSGGASAPDPFAEAAAK